MGAEVVTQGGAAFEARVLGFAVMGYLLAAALSAISTAFGTGRQRATFGLLAGALTLHTLAIGYRWVRLDHGPYVDMFEILSSNVWSLHLAAVVVFLSLPRLRPALAATLLLLAVLTVWMWLTPVKDTMAPVTYSTIWLPIHVTLGKFFLGLATPATGLALILLCRELAGMPFTSLPDTTALETAIYRLLLIAVVFQSLMLLAGAAWAQNAWARYWGWDPLESWAFITWTATLLFLHLRPRVAARPKFSAMFSILIFCLAFYTFFGVPFISTSPHKGAI